MLKTLDVKIKNKYMPDKKEIKNKLNQTFGKKNKNYSKLYSDSTAQQIMDARYKKAMSTAHLVDTTGHAEFLKKEELKKKKRDDAYKAHTDSVIAKSLYDKNMKHFVKHKTLVGNKNFPATKKKFDRPNLPYTPTYINITQKK